ncbi:hypothetical protein K456DRAFT_1917612 [Colletotrichum gloeosporioides 23]|nr:hypothetical protein K456DRAFT_1917612 [Colletotrichum gloeosporioides 23]
MLHHKGLLRLNDSSCFVKTTTIGWDEGAAASITELESFKHAYHLEGSNSKTTISNLVSFVNIGAGVGAFLSFFLNDKIGRLWSMRLYQTIYAAGSLISCFSYGNHGVLYVGRIIAGLGVGACTVVGPMSIAEMAPKSIRGLMTLWFNVCMLGGQALGIFTVFGCSTNISSEHSLQYQIPWFVQTFVPAIAIGLSFFSVESPRWLAIQGKQRMPLTLWGSGVFVYYERDFYGTVESPPGAVDYRCLYPCLIFRRQLGKKPDLDWPTPFADWHLQVTNYLPTIFGYIGVQGAGAKVYSSGLYAVAKMICCLVASLVFVDVLGRRKSLMIGITIQAACHAYLSGYLKYFTKDPDSVPKGASDAAIGIIYIHALGWAVGLYTLPYLFGAELWPNRIRSFGGALSQGFHWLFYFAITKATPSILSSMDIWGAFLFFVGWCILAFIYTLFFIPETSGLSLDEMDAIFQRPMHKMRQAASGKSEEERIGRRVSVEKEAVAHLERD